MKLSIIIPYYNVKPYTDELLKCLLPQITDEVEVILIDDGSKVPYKTEHSWCQVYRQNNKGVSSARNVGLSFATGEYVSFIDADDLVSDKYVQTILSKTPFDWLEMSWKSLPGGAQFDVKLTGDSDRLKNPSSVTRAFRREYIGDVRFNEQKQAAEDAEFIRAICKPGGRVAIVTEYLYFYRTYTPNSLTKRYFSGDTDTLRIVYHYKHVTADMTDLLEEIKREYKKHEIILLTEQCDIPELYQYADIKRPERTRGRELRGEPYDGFILIKEPPTAQICIYISHNHMCGIYTWVRAFCQRMHDTYNIMVLHEGMDSNLIEMIMPYADIRHNSDPVRCDVLLMMSIMDEIPYNINFKRSIQVIHSLPLSADWILPTDRDELVPVSEAVRKAWNIAAHPILNMTTTSSDTAHELYLVTASRLKDGAKGKDRMQILVEKLKAAGISFRWECYSDADPHIKGITYQPMTNMISRVYCAADYVVQLSDSEGFCYSIVEALECGTPCIVTDMDVLKEIGFIDGEHGYTFPMDMSRDVNCIRKIPKVLYTFNNDESIRQWTDLIGKSKGSTLTTVVRCTRGYRDMVLDRYVTADEVLHVTETRAKELLDVGYVVRIDDHNIL